MNALAALVRRDVALAVRRGGDAALTLGFFVVAAALFPFGVGPDPELLGRIGTGIVWVTALLAATLSLDSLFRADREDGSLELLALSGVPLEGVVVAKCLAHWLTTGLPVTVLAPLMALLLRVDADAYPALVAALALGTPALSLIGAVGAALVLGARRGGALTALLVMPLFIPVLVFGVGAVEAAMAGRPVLPHILIEGAILAASLPLAMLAGAGALRLAAE